MPGATSLRSLPGKTVPSVTGWPGLAGNIKLMKPSPATRLSFLLSADIVNFDFYQNLSRLGTLRRGNDFSNLNPIAHYPCTYINCLGIFKLKLYPDFIIRPIATTTYHHNSYRYHCQRPTENQFSG